MQKLGQALDDAEKSWHAGPGARGTLVQRFQTCIREGCIHHVPRVRPVVLCKELRLPPNPRRPLQEAPPRTTARRCRTRRCSHITAPRASMGKAHASHPLTSMLLTAFLCFASRCHFRFFTCAHFCMYGFAFRDVAHFGCPFFRACWGLGCQPAAPRRTMNSPLPSRKDGSQMIILHFFFCPRCSFRRNWWGKAHTLVKQTHWKVTKGNPLQIQHYFGTAKISGYSILIKHIFAEIMVWALFSVNRSFSTWCYQIGLQRRVTQYKHAYASFS